MERPLEPEELVREIYDGLNRRDTERVREHFDPEVEFVSATARVEGEASVFRGYDGMREYVAQISDIWEDAHWEVESVQQVDADSALAIVVFEGSGPGSGVEIEQRVAALFTVRNGKVLRIEGFSDLAEGRRSAGLE